MSSFVKGNLIKSRATFTDENGVKRDPDTVSVSIKDPSGTITAFDYGVDAELVKQAVGIYYVEIDTTAYAGRWSVIWSSTGDYQAVGQQQFDTVDTYF